MNLFMKRGGGRSEWDRIRERLAEDPKIIDGPAQFDSE